MTTDLLGEPEMSVTEPKPKRTRAARPRPEETPGARLAGGEAAAVATAAAPPQNMLALIGVQPKDLPSIDVDKLERLMAFQERMMARQAEIDFNEAKARVKAALVDLRITRSKSVRYDINKSRPALGKEEAFKYAPLEAIGEILAPLEAAEDLECSYTTSPRQGEGGGLVITQKLKHKGGHFELCEIPLPLDTSGGKSNIQGYGSTISFARRYLKCMGYDLVIVGEDDDGSGGFIAGDQVENLRRLVGLVHAKNNRFTEETFCRYLKVASLTLEELPQFKLRQAVSVLEEQAKTHSVNLDADPA
jgi:hypothetical protein